MPAASGSQIQSRHFLSIAVRKLLRRFLRVTLGTDQLSLLWGIGQCPGAVTIGSGLLFFACLHHGCVRSLKALSQIVFRNFGQYSRLSKNLYRIRPTLQHENRPLSAWGTSRLELFDTAHFSIIPSGFSRWEAVKAFLHFGACLLLWLVTAGTTWLMLGIC